MLRSRLPIKFPLYLATVPLCLLLLPVQAPAYDPPHAGSEGPRHVIVLSSATMDACAAVEASVEDLGGHVTFVYRPSVLVAFMPARAAALIAHRPEVIAVSAAPIHASSLGSLTWEQRAGLAIWNDYYMGLGNVEGDGRPPGLGPVRHEHPCGIPVPPEERDAGKRGYGQSAGSTSEYMLLDGPGGMCRRYLAIFVFPESNGAMSTENWGPSDPLNFMIAAVEGIEWWFARYGTARMTLDVGGPPPVNIPHEPISMSQAQESVWINALMDALGVGPGTYFQRVRSWNNGWVGPNDTWTNTYFIVNSQNDADGRFAANPNGDRWFDYSYLGGPFMVMTWDHDGWGNEDTDYMTAHETGHTFYALDEYMFDGCTDCCYDWWTSGYLNVVNTNCEREGGPSVECIMRNDTRDEYTNGSVCVYTRDQIGWRDSDADDIPDILDHPPLLSLSDSPPLINVPSPAWTGTVIPEVHDNMNPLRNAATGSSPGDDISVNTVETVEYRLNGGAWQPAAASNGSFDEPSESYSFTPALDLGVRTIVDVRALNSRGLYSSVKSDTVTYIDCRLWSDTFDDADVSDWSITNAGATIALDHTVPQGGMWCVKVTGASGAGQGAVAYSPENAAKHCNLDLASPYQLSFWFRYADFHWDQWVVFGHIRLLVDTPGLPLKYDPVGNWTNLTNLGNAFNTYIPANTWRQVTVNVDPPARTYTVTIGGVQLGSATFNAGLVPSTKLWFVENYSESNYMNGYYDTFAITGNFALVSVEPQVANAVTVRILSCAPNPFRGSTAIRYECPADARLTLAVYDVAGAEVRRLVDAECAAGGVREAVWDGRDRSGRAVVSGVYFARLSTASEAVARRILILR